MSRFKMVENTNYCVEVGKANRFSLVGIQGADLTDGSKTLTLALVWQLMRANIVATLKSLGTKSGRDITDQDILRWANSMSQKGGKSSQIRSFKDPSLSTGVFLLDVLNGLKPGYVDYNLVTPGRTEEDAYLNGMNPIIKQANFAAKLAISIARKIGAVIFLLPEDITQVRARLVVPNLANFANS